MWKNNRVFKRENNHIYLFRQANTGALLVISRLLLKNNKPELVKPALAALWPNDNNMNVVLDLGANIDCNEKKFNRLCMYGCGFYSSRSLENDKPKIALLNVGLEEYKGNDILKKNFLQF